MEEEIDLKELFNIFWRKKFIIILITLIFAGVGAYYTYNYTTPRYKSSTTLLLAQNYSVENMDEQTNEITQTDITLNQKLVSTYSKLVKSKTVIKQVLQNLDMSENLESDLEKNIQVKAVEDTQVIEITYSNEDPMIAYKIADELSNVFCDKVSEIYNINNVYIVDKAEIEETPYNINHIKDIIFFAFVGIGLSCIGIFISSLFDTTVKAAEDVERNTGLVVLAQIPELKTEGEKK